MNTITNAQRVTFLSDWWPKICAEKGWSKTDRGQRISFISGAIGRLVDSLLEVGRTKEFDDLKAASLAIIRPADLEAQLRQVNQDRTRLIFSIVNNLPDEIATYMTGATPEARGTAAEHYVLTILSKRFQTESIVEINDWPTWRLTQLRDTLARCITGLKKKRAEALV